MEIDLRTIVDTLKSIKTHCEDGKPEARNLFYSIYTNHEEKSIKSCIVYIYTVMELLYTDDTWLTTKFLDDLWNSIQYNRSCFPVRYHGYDEHMNVMSTFISTGTIEYANVGYHAPTKYDRYIYFEIQYGDSKYAIHIEIQAPGLVKGILNKNDGAITSTFLLSNNDQGDDIPVIIDDYRAMYIIADVIRSIFLTALQYVGIEEFVKATGYETPELYRMEKEKDYEDESNTNDAILNLMDLVSSQMLLSKYDDIRIPDGSAHAEGYDDTAGSAHAEKDETEEEGLLWTSSLWG